MTAVAGPSGPARPDPALAELEQELRVARFDLQTQRERADALAANFKRYMDEDRTVLRRVQSLVSVRRKTLRMDDLRRALGYLESDGR